MYVDVFQDGTGIADTLNHQQMLMNLYIHNLQLEQIVVIQVFILYMKIVQVTNSTNDLSGVE